jgi:hypothetical protein
MTLAAPATADPFGVQAFDGQVTAGPAPSPLPDPDNPADPANFASAYTQAGGHPYALSVQIRLNRDPNPLYGAIWPPAPVKDILVDSPAGLVGNPTVVAHCRTDELVGPGGGSTVCPVGSQVGWATDILPVCFITCSAVQTPSAGAVYSMVAPPNVAARFGFVVANTIVLLDAQLHKRSDGEYVVSLNAKQIGEGLPLLGSVVTLWGTPADPSHDFQRACPGQSYPVGLGNFGPHCASGDTPRPFLTLPTSCRGPLTTTMRTDSWFDPGHFETASFTSHLPPGLPDPIFNSLEIPIVPPDRWGAPQGTTGCDQVPFDPEFSARPSTLASPGPSGWAFDLTIPQDNLDDPNAIAQGHLKKAVVTLPEGVRVSPSSADGLGACSPAQIALNSDADPTCPDSSKIGSLTVDTPLLTAPLTGSVYVATPYDNPSGSLIALYFVAKGPGVLLKLSGSASPDPKTGRLSATFDDIPQQPFSHLHIEFFGGSRASLSNPPRCGTYTTSAVMTSWSGKTVTSNSSFATSHDGKGTPCPPAQFAPKFIAGTSTLSENTPVGGAFSPFNLQLQRTDDDSEFNSLSSLSLPPGLLADVGSVSVRCTEVQADAHACPVESHIGTVNVGAGAGPDPFYVPGDVYLTGPYKGNPFGIAVIVHAQAGPFDLGYVVVKGAIQIHDDGSVTVATDPFPAILQGIPLQVRDVRVNLDRPGFTFNPTSCNPMSIDGTVLSTDNQHAGVSSRFQVSECANLAFKPSFTVSTAGKTSKADGASLRVHLATHQGPTSPSASGESNIAKVDVQLPVTLPARLPTLQKACTAAQFATDPAGCPVGSFVGTAIAHTPILKSPLSGPAILVSHGGQAFPDLVLVLQGEGVRINLTGHTQIKKGITFNHFETVPDAPVSSFDLTLPAGPHGVLTTDVPGRNLCATTRTVTVTKRVTRRVHGHTRRVTVKAKKAVAAPLLMPTTMTAQNGAVIHQNTKIAVTGCAAVKTKAKKAKSGKFTRG